MAHRMEGDIFSETGPLPGYAERRADVAQALAIAGEHELPGISATSVWGLLVLVAWANLETLQDV